MPDDQLPFEHRPLGDEGYGAHRRHHPHHHRHHHHHSRHRLRQKFKVAVLIAVGVVLALLAWYLVVAYLDDRALGPTSHRLAQMLRASGLNR